MGRVRTGQSSGGQAVEGGKWPGLMPPAWEEDASVLPEGAGGCAGTSACWCIADSSSHFFR